MVLKVQVSGCYLGCRKKDFGQVVVERNLCTEKSGGSAVHGSHNGSARWILQMFVNFWQVIEIGDMVIFLQEGVFRFITNDLISESPLSVFIHGLTVVT